MTPRVVVVGLGPAGPELLTSAAVAAIDCIPRQFVRTTRHPAAKALVDAYSFDALYESSADLGEVYRGITDHLVSAATEHGEVLYAVPGSPVVAERTVDLLRALDLEVETIPGLSFFDLACVRLGIDPLAQSVRLVDGHRFAVDAAGQRGPLLVAQCDAPWVLSQIKLSIDAHPGTTVTVLQRLGLPDENIAELNWDDIDREIQPDHLTSLWIPELASPVGAELVRFAELVRTLRERCPWDREQTHESLMPHLLEEAQEVVEAIENLGGPDGYDKLADELGDLLMQVFIHATLATEEGEFTIADVARGVHDKMVRRHPHVFGDVVANTAEEVAELWETIKAGENAPLSRLTE